jgi:hypothetical protein
MIHMTAQRPRTVNIRRRKLQFLERMYEDIDKTFIFFPERAEQGF